MQARLATSDSTTAPAPRLLHLSHAHRRLVGLMQSLHYGRIEHLEVRSGEPVFAPPSSPVVIREIKLAADDPEPVKTAGDYALRKQVVELLGHLTAFGDGTIPRIDVKHGLPFLVHLPTPVA